MADFGGLGDASGGAPDGAGADAVQSPSGAVEVPVSREGELWLIGGEMPPAWRLALWRGNGATLWWDAADADGNRGVLISEAPAAAPWIGDLGGSAVAAMLAKAGDSDVAPPTVALAQSSPLVGHARDIAFARWRQAWWPASREALVPPLDPRILAAEKALALHALASASTNAQGAASAQNASDTAADGTARAAALTERARDAGFVDEPALASALFEFAAAELRFGPLPPAAETAPEHPTPGELAAKTRALVDSRGISATVPPGGNPEGADELPRDIADVPPSSGTPVADAALHRAPDLPKSSIGGFVDVDLSYTPNGVVDAAGRAHWRVGFRGASATVTVEILAAPRFGNEPALEPELCASFAGVNARLTLADGVWRGEHPVPLSTLTHPPAETSLLLYIPGHDRQRPSPDAPQLIRIARARLIAPTSASESDAAVREIR